MGMCVQRTWKSKCTGRVKFEKETVALKISRRKSGI